MNRHFPMHCRVPARSASRRALGACLGLGVLLLSRTAPARQDDKNGAPGDKTAYTLRMKFKQDNVSRYKMNLQMAMTLPKPGATEPTTVHSLSTMTIEQKVSKLLPNGGAEVVMTVSDLHSKAEGQEVPVQEIPPTTARYDDALGKVSGMQGGSSAMNNMIGANGLAGLGSFLSEKPVQVGDTWTQKVTLPPNMGGTSGLLKCSFVKIETVGGVKTARIHTVMTAPFSVLMNAAGQPTKQESEAVMTMTGTTKAISDIHFALAEGMIVHTSASSDTSMLMRARKGAPKGTPETMKMALKMDMEMTLVPPDAPVITDPKP